MNQLDHTRQKCCEDLRQCSGLLNENHLKEEAFSHAFSEEQASLWHQHDQGCLGIQTNEFLGEIPS